MFTVYEATFERWDSSGRFHYAGMSEKSLQGRGANHAEMPVDWGRGMKRATLHLRCHKTFSCRKTALAEEARLATALMLSDEEHARGGPWSLPRIMPRHRKEMEAVLGCGSASQVIRLAVEGTPLWKHLHDEPYRDGVGGRGGGGWTKVKGFNTKAKRKKLGCRRATPGGPMSKKERCRRAVCCGLTSARNRTLRPNRTSRQF